MAVQRSAEILAVSRRWLDAVITGDRNSLKNLFSGAPHLRFIGTASGEMWEGDAVRQAVGDFFGSIPDGSRHEEIFGEAFEDGPVGWSCFSHLVWIADSSEPAEVRTTLVLALEDGAWKIVQRHASVPAPTEETFKMKQKGISELVEAARESYDQWRTEGLASVVFTDIVNSSGLASAMGDRIWSQLVEEHFKKMRNIIEAASGQLVKSLGDGTMSRFSSARQALRAAYAIQSTLVADIDGPALKLRIGVHTGDVVESDKDFFGTVVNKAARIAGQAGPGEILVSAATHAVTGEEAEFVFSDPAQVSLRGFKGEHQVYRLEWQDSPPG